MSKRNSVMHDLSKDQGMRGLGTLLLFFVVAFGLIWLGDRFLWPHVESWRMDAERGPAAVEDVWTRLMAMPEQDRVVIAGLALTCKPVAATAVEAQAVRAQIIDCLRSATADPNVGLPAGVSPDEARRSLDRLLSHEQ